MPPAPRPPPPPPPAGDHVNPRADHVADRAEGGRLRRLGRGQAHSGRDRGDREGRPPKPSRSSDGTARRRNSHRGAPAQATMPLTEPRKISVPSEAPMITMPRRLPNI